MKNILVVTLITLTTVALAQHVPTFEEVISLRSIGGLTMSADGKNIIFSVTSTDWNDNRFDSELWLSKDGKKPFQLTNSTKANSSGASFSPDGQWIAFLADRGNKTQIHIMRLDGGEARAITKDEEGISSFEWHPSGTKFILLKPEKDDKKDREKKFGAYETDDKEFTLSHLWSLEFKPDMLDPSEMPCYETADSLKAKSGCIELPKPTRLTEGKFTVTSFAISPDGKMVVFNHQPDPLINSSLKSDISTVDLADKKITARVTNASSDFFEDWSPDSKELLFSTSLTDTTSYFYMNSKLLVLNLDSKATRQIAKDLDENISNVKWRTNGIYASAWNKTKRPLYKIDPKTGNHSVALSTPEQIINFAVSKAGDKIALVGRNGNQLNEVFIGATKLTDMTSQISNWKVAQSEVISWKSKDGAVIEGVLHKPSNYVASKKYPLLVMIHGGPTGIDTPTPVPGGSVYPVLQWLDKGCLVLRVNYRGSAGYGEAFRSLNVKNLGVGDAWDVLSGVDYLDSKGMIDRSKMGCMGWSQGGYISAFLTTNTDIFKAISVGAGISNWVTYYVSTDIHPFTRQYLKATPWSDEEIYKKTSPMTNINNAKTPTLIQHGEFDRRVPISNAYELVQGLRDKGVPTELIVYKGFGHGITKPKERLAATTHNFDWFNKYVFNDK
jgi:dipeptidyl aminopeptidase/acylaminoacyl peptidase